MKARHTMILTERHMKISNKEFAEEPVQEENMGIEMSQ